MTVLEILFTVSALITANCPQNELLVSSQHANQLKWLPDSVSKGSTVARYDSTSLLAKKTA